VTLVIGLGNPDRGDDGVGLAVADRVADLVRERGLVGVDVQAVAEPSRLLEVWAGVTDVVVVDAVRGGAHPPGTVLVLEVGERPLPAWTGSGGTHALGLTAAVGLARALDLMPQRLVVVGVAGTDFCAGAPLSGPVRVAVQRAAEAVVDQAWQVSVDRKGRLHPLRSTAASLAWSTREPS